MGCDSAEPTRASNADSRPAVRVQRPPAGPTATAHRPTSQHPAQAAAAQTVEQQPSVPATFAFATLGTGASSSTEKARRAKGRTPASGGRAAGCPGFTAPSGATGMAWSPYPGSSDAEASTPYGGIAPAAASAREAPDSSTATSAAPVPAASPGPATVAEDLQAQLNLSGPAEAEREGGSASNEADSLSEALRQQLNFAGQPHAAAQAAVQGAAAPEPAAGSSWGFSFVFGTLASAVATAGNYLASRPATRKKSPGSSPALRSPSATHASSAAAAARATAAEASQPSPRAFQPAVAPSFQAAAAAATQLGPAAAWTAAPSTAIAAVTEQAPAAAAAPPLSSFPATDEPAADGGSALPPLPPYELLEQRAGSAADGGQPLLKMEGGKRRSKALMYNFQNSGAVKNQALALYVNNQLFKRAFLEFKEFLVAAMDEQLWRCLGQLQPREGSQALFPYFARFVTERYAQEIKAYRDVVQTTDLRSPHSWFPVARALQRRIIYHAGPTNSGKTYNALQAMTAAKSGVYCGPLRLLAMEVYDTCNAEGLCCNLITGQEQREVPGAQHTACTVEMVGMQQRVDVAVIDEVQMIGDEGRGWAWSRALMGVPAKKVHLCGDSSAVPLVKQLCEEMGEQLEVRAYDRFTPLEVEPSGLVGGYSAVQPGDCIVAFSRRDIYAIKQLIEQTTRHRVCVVYGALPPETRRQQARLFNEQASGYRVMVASDAIGMGLNLNIRRVIFHSVHKHAGREGRVPVSVSMLKQIAGRAGRRGSKWAKGLATCLNTADVPHLRKAIDAPLSQLTTPTAGLFPEFEQFEVYAGQRPGVPHSVLLEGFAREALLDSSYFFCKQENMVQAAQMLGELQLCLALKDMFSFCMAPASTSDLRIGAALLNFATKYSQGLPVTLDIAVPSRVPSCTDELRHVEAAHQVSMLWLWLSYRFEAGTFPNRDKVEAQAEFICALLDMGLKRLTRWSKDGVDIAARAARPEHENVMSCFSKEFEFLDARRRQQRAAERRQQVDWRRGW